MKVYLLVQTDIWQSKSSRCVFGVYSTKVKAIDAAKQNDLYTSDSVVLVEEFEIDNFIEIWK
jgi:hypothetical protein